MGLCYAPLIDKGTIHLRRQHFLWGRGKQLAKFADE